MNIFEETDFRSSLPVITKIKNSERVNYFAVALGEGATLKKHKTSVPAMLVVVIGEINFVLNDREYIFKQGDCYDIPQDEEHFVVGILKENVFTILQEL